MKEKDILKVLLIYICIHIMYKKMLSLSNYNLILQLSFVPLYKFNYFDPWLTSIMICDYAALDYPFANYFKIHSLFFCLIFTKGRVRIFFSHYIALLQRRACLYVMVLFIYLFLSFYFSGTIYSLL